MKRTSRIVAVAIAAAAAGASASAAPAATRVGAPASGATAFQLVGVVDQNGSALTFGGFLTRVTGVPTQSLFFGHPKLLRQAAQARLTFFGRATITDRTVVRNVIVTQFNGTITVYLRTRPGASFAVPFSFGQGRKVATEAVTFQDVLNVQAPNAGVATASGDLTQKTARGFSLGGHSYVFGRKGLRLHAVMTGEGRRTRAFPPRASIVLGGSAVVQ